MRKSFIYILLLACVISSCNLPAQTVITPTKNLVETQISQKLTSTAKVPVSQATTAAPTKANTVASPTNIPASPTTPATATLTPTQALTATITTTPTGIPGDPRTALGTPAWQDTFQKPTTWGLSSAYDDGHTRVSIDSGKIVLKSYEGNGWHGWRMMNTKIQNYYLEASIKPLACSANDLYGLIFRFTDSNKGYWYGITCDGKYGLQSGDIYDFTDVIKPKTNAAIKAGSNQTNRVGVLIKGNKISLYANGKLLEEITSDAFPNAGTFGYFIAGYKTPGFTFESTEIGYWNLP